jgi:superfamily I DNA/RNA helicase/mRNA-degrading endonuclease RelE of RelBE toxin-antitoxin system
MAFEVDVKPAFLRDLVLLPQSVQRRAVAALEIIAEDPISGRGNVKKVFKHLFKNVYRYRIGDYRLLYCLGEGCVGALAIGHRQDIYERFQPASDHLHPRPAAGAEPIAISPAPGIAPSIVEEPEPTSDAPPPSPEDDEVLPPPDRSPNLLRQLLSLWGVPEDVHDRILACHQPEDLFDLGLPDETVERILHWQQPPTATQIIEQPTLDVPNLADLEQYLEGTLTGFLLKLDPEQQQVAYRPQRGARLVKGGPGSGKSLVALYHIRHRIASASANPPRILFVTYTQALTRASRQLLDSLLGDRKGQVDVQTLDAVARQILAAAGEPHEVADRAQQEAALRVARTAITLPPLDPARRKLQALPDDYLLEEIDWVIEGRQVPDLAAYLAEPRAGRLVPLDARLRRAVWQVAQTFRDRLERQKVGTYTMLRARALDLVRVGRGPEPYDAVVVDEGQDLPPVALALCAELCASPDGLLVTADANQSIYGKGFGWIRAHSAFNFRGRTTVLRRNYRSTRAIAAAAASLMAESDSDAESLAATAMREGPPPVLARVRNEREEAQVIADHLVAWAEELRLPVGAAAVLVRTERLGQSIARALEDLKLEATVVTGRTLDLKDPRVKVLTMHSAKGLEFPIVVVPRVDHGYLPFLAGVTDPDARAERTAEERRLLFVALTRAMRRLLLTCSAGKESPFIADLDLACWAQLPPDTPRGSSR